jgi:hypothetical protein
MDAERFIVWIIALLGWGLAIWWFVEATNAR